MVMNNYGIPQMTTAQPPVPGSMFGQPPAPTGEHWVNPNTNPMSDMMARPYLAKNSTPNTSAMAPSMPSTTSPNINIPTLAHGGKVPRGLISVHMNPKELDILDYLQGHRKYAPDHNRMYPDLEGVFRNAHMKEGMINHAKQHFASGGHVRHLPHMRPISAENGINGDSVIAYIGPHMRQVFNEALGHKYDRNPYDGHPQYWNLGGFLSGLGNTVMNAGKSAWNFAKPILGTVARAALPSVANAVGETANDYLPGSGAIVSNLAGNLGGQVLDNTIPQGPQTEFQSQASDAIRQGIQNYGNYTRGGGSINNAGDIGRAVLGGFSPSQNAQNLNTGVNLAGSYLRSNQDTTPSPTANPVLQMGHNLLSRYNNQLNQPQQQPQIQPA